MGLNKDSTKVGHANRISGTRKLRLQRVEAWLDEARTQIFSKKANCFQPCTLDELDLLLGEAAKASGIIKCVDAAILESEFLGLRGRLYEDVMAAMKGDPAVRFEYEVIECYPSVFALTSYRIANLLQCNDVPILPRMVAESAHRLTGIDIHPGATIGRGFFIDHGTGVVIGETAVIENNVRIYQGVTLGAKSFPKDDRGWVVKGQKRHPIVEDNVVIYSGATILGRIRIGKGSVIGGNVWVTEDVPPNTIVRQGQSRSESFSGLGEGI